MEDVVYLKNGNLYRGMIIEQVPNVSLKIETIGGNVFAVNIADVAKITKEHKVAGGMQHEHEGFWGYSRWHHSDIRRIISRQGKEDTFFSRSC